LETTDVLSDILQLEEVIRKNQKYNAPPISNVVNAYTVAWRQIDNNNGTGFPLLGYSLSWNGAMNDLESYNYGDDCLFNGQKSAFFSNSINSRPNYDTEKEVCVSLDDVFTIKFPELLSTGQKIYPTNDPYICPNNQTGIYDESSFKIISAEFDGSFTTSMTKSAFNILNYYKKLGNIDLYNQPVQIVVWNLRSNCYFFLIRRILYPRSYFPFNLRFVKI
jgi:hypothetical protein